MTRSTSKLILGILILMAALAVGSSFAATPSYLLTSNAVWLAKPNGASTYYGNNGTGFINAWNAAATGDTIELGPGEFVVNNALSAINKSVNIKGTAAGAWDKVNSHFSGGTIIRGEIQTQAVAPGNRFTISEVKWADFAVEGSTNCIILCATNSFFRNIACGSTNNANGHLFMLAFGGGDNEVEQCRCYNGAGDGFVIMNTTNVICKTIYVWNTPQAIYLKSDATQDGNRHVGNIVLNNIIVDRAGLIVVHATGGYATGGVPNGIDDVTIKGVIAEYKTKVNQVLYMPCDRTNYIRNVSMSECRFINIDRIAAIVPEVANEPKIEFQNISLERIRAVRPDKSSPEPITYTARPYDLSQFNARLIQMDSWRTEQSGIPLTQFATVAIPAQSSVISVSSGVSSTPLRVAHVLGNHLFVVWQNTLTLASSRIIAGDPCRVVGGAAAGVYTNLSGVQVSPVNDNPVVGAIAGDFYFDLGYTALADGVVAGVSEVRPGKYIARLFGAADSGGTAFTITGSATFSQSPGLNEIGTLTGQFNTSAGPTLAVYTATAPSETPISSVMCILRPWVWNNLTTGGYVNLGVFGSGKNGFNGEFFFPITTLNLQGKGIEMVITNAP